MKWVVYCMLCRKKCTWKLTIIQITIINLLERIMKTKNKDSHINLPLWNVKHTKCEWSSCSIGIVPYSDIQLTCIIETKLCHKVLHTSGNRYVKDVAMWYMSLIGCSSQICAGRTVPVRVTRRCAAEWYNLVGSSLLASNGTAEFTISNTRWSYSGFIVSSVWSCASQWHQAFRAARICAWLEY